MEEPQNSQGALKLKGQPVPVEIYPDYCFNKLVPGYSGDKPDELGPDPDSKLEAFLHPLTRDEFLDVEAVWTENYRGFKARGGNEEDSKWKAGRVANAQHLFYCVRVSDRKGAPRLFTEMEAAQINVIENDRLLTLYNTAFVPTKEERKNCFRARLGTESVKPSNLPSTSGGLN